MNLNFLSPLYLFGLLGIAVPILIHLLTRRQQKHIRFSAVHLLFQSQKRSIKRSVPNRRLLLLIRCLGIILLSLALANPIFSFSGPGDFLPDSPSARVFILDDSYSMGTRTGQTTFYVRAVEAVLDLAQSISSDSVYSVVFGSAPGRVFMEWTDDPSRAEKLLKSTQASARTTRIGQAFSEALRLLETVSQKDKRIFILTDRDKNGWTEEDFSATGEGLRYPVHVIDFSGMQSGINPAAVESVEVRQEFLSNSRIMRVKMRAVNLSASKPINKLKASLWINGRKQTAGVLDLPEKSTGEREFSFPLQANTSLNGEVRIEDDPLTEDNRRFFNYQPDRSIKVLVVDGDPKTVEHQSETFYLERALNPFTVSLSNIDPTVSTLSELPMRRLFDYSVVILCNVRDLPFDYERELEEFVMRGGALFIALGDQVDPKFYNEKLGNLLPVTLKSMQQVGKQDEPFRFLIEPSQHQVLKVFTGRMLEEMKSIRFHSLYSVEPKEGAKFTVPMWFENHVPALIESEIGKGKVILFVSSIDRDWNDFAIQPTFLPWIQRWVKYSARGLDSIMRQELLVGEPFILENSAVGSRIYIESPGGKIIMPYSREGKIVFEDTFRPGVYRLQRGTSTSEEKHDAPQVLPQLPPGTEPAGAFTVNIDPRESFSEKISDEEIRNLLPGTTVTFSDGYQHRESAHPEEGHPLSTPFLLLVGSMLLFEGWLIRKE
ncbi:MAG: BatA and WFA domain-containing protein [Nitrospinae bacterium]|nr:BatA and WFA domain-containing protein [Nitrospinota bacterium]